MKTKTKTTLDQVIDHAIEGQLANWKEGVNSPDDALENIFTSWVLKQRVRTDYLTIEDYKLLTKLACCLLDCLAVAIEEESPSENEIKEILELAETVSDAQRVIFKEWESLEESPETN